jgi:hypothetical protein
VVVVWIWGNLHVWDHLVNLFIGIEVCTRAFYLT